VLGDGRVVAARRVMLHCARLSLPALVGDGSLELTQPVPPDLEALWSALGGDLSALAP
jgi:hypothetical protein